MSTGTAQRGRSRRNILFIFPSVLIGFILGSYSSTIQRIATLTPQSFSLLLDLPAPANSNKSTTDNTSPEKELDHNTTTFDDRYRSPVESMLPHFANRAVEKEMAKHDRLVVDSLAYLTSFNSAQEYAELINRQPDSSKKLTIVILTVNRAVPYVAVTLASLIRGHSKEEFAEKLNVHVCNLEKRPDRINTYYLFQTLRERLGGFISFHSWNEKYPELSSIKRKGILYMEEQRRDYIKALTMCKEAGSKWCVVLEDDTVLPDELECERLSGGNGTFVVDATKLMLVKLYAPFNNAFDKSGKSMSSKEYGRAGEGYDKDRAIDVVEARENGESVKEVKYSLKLSTAGYGIVSNAYPAHILDPMIDYLTNNKFQQGQPTDTAINFLYYLKTKKTILEMRPSLVNHVGHYSENNNGGASVGKRLSTDVRFQIDDAHRR
mmetsp:Transcript_3133/g.6783  ORF Transcript_3133/g.6783 Transcript_3133/m.6783 type:complete len:435 (-) Transcript_3133:883-2187(-)